jgi:hypothetical protein
MYWHLLIEIYPMVHNLVTYIQFKLELKGSSFFENGVGKIRPETAENPFLCLPFPPLPLLSYYAWAAIF